MAKNLRFIVLCVLTITICSTGLVPPVASAAETRNWIDSPLYHREIPKPVDGEGCVIEKWTIKTNPNYDYDTKEYLPQDLCVHRAQKVVYAFFERQYKIKGSPYGIPERVMVVSFDDDIVSKLLTPIEDKFKDDYMTQIQIVGDAKLSFGRYSYANQGITLRVLDNIIEHLVLNPVSTLYMLNLDSSRIVTNNQGDPIIFTTFAFSKDGHQLTGIEKNRLLLINTKTSGATAIAKKIFTASYYWPAPSFNLFVSNDGSIVGYLGSNTRAYILEVNDLCTGLEIDDPMTPDTQLHSRCRIRELSDLLEGYDPRPELGYYAYSFPSITSDNSDLTYQSHHTGLWHQISYENFSANKYMALGDSYASGEGDIDQFGVPHYLDGTNVWGDYKVGIPRENCHVSDHSYPFLLGAHAGLQQHFGMETVACSGAVQLNIAKRLDDFRPHAEYIAGVYMGQFTQRDGQDRPRLEGIPNATQLQQEALDKLLPGRVQQVEQLKRLQPYVATVQISGNDLNFAPIIQSCALNWPGTHKEQTASPVPEDCDWSRSEFRSKVAAAILSNRADLVKLYGELKQASPNTQFYAVGYPLFVKQAMFCLNIPSFSPAEVEFITESIKFTNATIRSAASEAGFRYLNIEDALGDQVICGKDGAMTSPFDFVSAAAMADMKRGATAEEVLTKYGITNPPTRAYLKRLFTDWERVRAINPKASPYLKFLEVTQELSHPNAEGHRLIANKLIDALGNESILTANCDGRVILCPDAEASKIPNVPTYFGDELSSTGMVVELVSIVFKTIQNGVEDVTKTGYDGGLWVVRQGSKLKITLTPRVDIASGAKIVLHSNTYELGELSLESPGVYAAEITIPSSVPVGMHTVEIAGTTTSGSPYYSLMPVAIIGSQDDEDGDGVEDMNNSCLYVNMCMQPVVSSPTTDSSQIGDVHAGNPANGEGIASSLTDSSLYSMGFVSTQNSLTSITSAQGGHDVAMASDVTDTGSKQQKNNSLQLGSWAALVGLALLAMVAAWWVIVFWRRRSGEE